MVDVVKNGSDTEIAGISIVQQSEEYASKKPRRNAAICDGLPDIALFRVEGIKLRRDAFHFSKSVITGSDRIGDCSPPFIGSSTVDKYDHMSPPGVMINLPEGYILASKRIDHDHILVLHRHKRVPAQKTWFYYRKAGLRTATVRAEKI